MIPHRRLYILIIVALFIACEKPAPPPPLPELALDPVEIDFGVVTQGETASAQFAVRNVGQVNAILGQLQSTCPCISGKFEKNYLVPGEATRATVTFVTADTPGEVRETLIIPIDDERRIFKYLTFKGIVKPGLLVRPDYHKITGADACKEGELHSILRNLSDADITLVSVQVAGKGMRIGYDRKIKFPFTLDPGRELEIAIFVTPAIKGESVGGRVIIKTRGEFRSAHTITVAEEPGDASASKECVLELKP